MTKLMWMSVCCKHIQTEYLLQTTSTYVYGYMWALSRCCSSVLLTGRTDKMKYEIWEIMLVVLPDGRRHHFCYKMWQNESAKMSLRWQSLFLACFSVSKSMNIKKYACPKFEQFLWGSLKTTSGCQKHSLVSYIINDSTCVQQVEPADSEGVLNKETTSMK